MSRHLPCSLGTWGGTTLPQEALVLLAERQAADKRPRERGSFPFVNTSQVLPRML